MKFLVKPNFFEHSDFLICHEIEYFDWTIAYWRKFIAHSNRSANCFLKLTAFIARWIVHPKVHLFLTTKTHSGVRVNHFIIRFSDIAKLFLLILDAAVHLLIINVLISQTMIGITDSSKLKNSYKCIEFSDFNAWIISGLTWLGKLLNLLFKKLINIQHHIKSKLIFSEKKTLSFMKMNF